MAMAPVAQQVAQQVANLFSVLFMLTGIGIPLSMPPAPEDPFLSQIAPERCVYYSRWAGVAQPEPDSQNQIDRLYLEPEVQRFFKEFEPRLRRAAAIADRQTGEPLFSEVGMTLGNLVLTQPTAVFVSDVIYEPASLEGGVVIKLADKQAAVEKVLAKLKEIIPPEALSPVDINGAPFTQARGPNSVQLTWGIHDGYLMFGIGDDAITQILDRSKTPAPNWLTRRQEQNDLPRRATFTYADLSAIAELTTQIVDDPELAGIVEATGLLQLKSYVSVTGLDETRFVSRTKVEISGPPKGLLRAIKGEPLDDSDLASVPSDALIAMAANVDATHLFDVLMEFISETEPRNASQIVTMLGEVQRSTGVDLTKDVLGSLGQCWRIYTSPRDGGLVSGWIASVAVADADTLRNAEKQLVATFQAERAANAPVRAEELDGKTIYTVSTPPGFPIAPSWCLTGDQLVIGLFPQAVRGHITNTESQDSIAKVPEVQKLLNAENAPTAVAYYDTTRLLRIAYPFVQVSVQVYAGLLKQEGIDFDVSLLPSTTALCRHARPSLISVRAVDEGIQFESYQSLPGGSFGALAPLITAALLPAGHSARLAAERSRSINHLRQIVLATINYESAYRHYPAAYNTDENGKPLLSWRVHILPFIEEQALYERFHLDEPWNSPHNRKLIPLMPTVYPAPGSDVDPGKTVYVAVRDIQGVIVPPDEQSHGQRIPKGVQIRKLRDGTSKTIILVEASGELAVIWTKPDDFEPDNDDPIKGLVGLRKEGFLAGYGDGSTRLIPKTIKKATLKALFTRDGGERIEGF